MEIALEKEETSISSLGYNLGRSTQMMFSARKRCLQIQALGCPAMKRYDHVVVLAVDNDGMRMSFVAMTSKSYDCSSMLTGLNMLIASPLLQRFTFNVPAVESFHTSVQLPFNRWLDFKTSNATMSGSIYCIYRPPTLLISCLHPHPRLVCDMQR